jgi:hypothetical protein
VWPTEIRFGQFDGDHRRFLFATREYKAGETLMDQLWAWSVEDGSVELLHDWRGGVQPYPWEFMTLSHAGTRLTFMGREEGNQVLAELGLDPPGPPRVLFEIPSELWRIHRLVRRDGDRLIVQCQVKAHRESGPVTASDGTLLANLFEGLVEIDLATVAASREVVER